MPLKGKVSRADNLVSSCQMLLQDLTDPFSIIDGEYRILWANRKKAGEHNLRQKDIIRKICYEIFFRSISNILEVAR